jgi:hypothetical protein
VAKKFRSEKCHRQEEFPNDIGAGNYGRIEMKIGPGAGIPHDSIPVFVAKDLIKMNHGWLGSIVAPSVLRVQ